MTKKARKIPTMLAAAAAAILLAAPEAQATTGFACFSDWSTAAPVAKRERLITLDKLSRQVEDKFDGRLLKAILCRRDERFVYRVVVRKWNGRLGTAIVDAQPMER